MTLCQICNRPLQGKHEHFMGVCVNREQIDQEESVCEQSDALQEIENDDADKDRNGIPWRL